MATRCTIKIEGIEYAKIYKHYDGYPQATFEWLEKFNSYFQFKRGDDPNYKFAQLLRDSVRNCSTYDLDPSQFTGWGVVAFDEDWCEDYEYTLQKDGSVTIKEI